MAKGGILGSQNPIFGNQPTNVQQQQMGMGNVYAGTGAGAAQAFQNWLAPFAKKGMGMVTPGNLDYQKLWQQTASQYKNQLMPQLSGAGILTSGPGLQALSQGLGNLSTQFTNDQLNNYMKMLSTTGGLEAGIPDMYSGLARSLFGSVPSGNVQSGVIGGLGALGQLGQGAGGLMSLGGALGGLF